MVVADSPSATPISGTSTCRVTRMVAIEPGRHSDPHQGAPAGLEGSPHPRRIRAAVDTFELRVLLHVRVLGEEPQRDCDDDRRADRGAEGRTDPTCDVHHDGADERAEQHAEPIGTRHQGQPTTPVRQGHGDGDEGMPGQCEYRVGHAEQEDTGNEGPDVRGDPADRCAGARGSGRVVHPVLLTDPDDEPSGRQARDQLSHRQHRGGQRRCRQARADLGCEQRDDGNDRALPNAVEQIGQQHRRSGQPEQRARIPFPCLCGQPATISKNLLVSVTSSKRANSDQSSSARSVVNTAVARPRNLPLISSIPSGRFGLPGGDGYECTKGPSPLPPRSRSRPSSPGTVS